MSKLKKGDIVQVVNSGDKGIFIGRASSDALGVLIDGYAVVSWIPREHLKLVEQEERVCEWVESGTNYPSFSRACGVDAFYDLKTFCDNCSGKVVLKEKMCTLGGIEFPIPKVYSDLSDDMGCHTVKLEYKAYEFENETDRHTFMIALQAAVKQAIEEAK